MADVLKTELARNQEKVRGLLRIIIDNINRIVEYLNLKGTQRNEEITKTINTLITALEMIERMENSELKLLKILREKNVEGVRSELASEITLEKQLEKELNFISATKNMDALRKILNLEKEINNLNNIITAQVQNI